MSDVKDVPPAGGEVEVLAWVDSEHRVDYYNKVVDNLAVGTELVDRAQVLRLQAENDNLRLQCGGMQMTIDDLQSELIKARELISETISGTSRWQLDSNLHERLRVYITAQSDPFDEFRMILDEPVAWMTECLWGDRKGVIEQTEGPDSIGNLEYWTPAFPVYRKA